MSQNWVHVVFLQYAQSGRLIKHSQRGIPPKKVGVFCRKHQLFWEEFLPGYALWNKVPHWFFGGTLWLSVKRIRAALWGVLIRLDTIYLYTVNSYEVSEGINFICLSIIIGVRLISRLNACSIVKVTFNLAMHAYRGCSLNANFF